VTSLETANAYLETNVLAGWLQFFEEERERFFRRMEKRTKKSLILLRDVQNRDYLCAFKTSDWSLAELPQIIRDSKISMKMISDGRSPAWFNRYKTEYSLTSRQIHDIEKVIERFKQFISGIGIEIEPCQVNPLVVQRIASNYSLNTSDALHLAIAKGKCNFFISNDSDFLNHKAEIYKIDRIRVIEPLTLRSEKGCTIENPSFNKRPSWHGVP